jgi:hypothetical protein
MPVPHSLMAHRANGRGPPDYFVDLFCQHIGSIFQLEAKLFSVFSFAARYLRRSPNGLTKLKQRRMFFVYQFCHPY